jgi:hypothetical protein
VNEIVPGGCRDSRPASPPPSAERGTLSEAWYRALYPARPAALAKPAPSIASAASSGSPPDRAARPVQTPAQRPSARDTPAGAAPARRTLTIANVSRLRERRVAAAPAAARANPAPAARRTTCSLELPEGRLDLLLQQRGRRVHVVALAGEAAGVRVRAALERARSALAAHGVRTTIDLRERGPV